MNAAQIHVSTNIESRAITAPGNVGASLAEFDEAEAFAGRRKDGDTAGAGGEEVAGVIEFEAVGKAFLRSCFAGEVGEETAGAELSVGVNGISHPDGAVWIGVGDVEGRGVGGESESVGAGKLGGEQGNLARGGDAINAAKIEFAAGVIELSGKAVGGVGEVEIAGGMKAAIIGAIEALALKLVGEGHFAAVGGENADAAVAVFAGDEAA